MSELQIQIEKARMQVHTDSYPMSIGELVNLYDDKELDIHPEFQRIYRWSEEQKSKLIESILLGIPLPSIFVAQRQDGVWDVVDGLQRISTILSFMGKLLDQNGNLLQPLRLQSTKYLPSLKNKVWENPHDKDTEIDLETKRIFKREKLDIKIIKRESEGDTKFELFQRLNTGGSKLSDQEVRNCMILMINPKSYDWLKKLASNEDFINATPISEKQKEESYNFELVLRFIVQRHADLELKKENSDVAPYLNAEVTRLFSEISKLDYTNEENVFNLTFKLINKALSDNSFKKYNHGKSKYEGAISLPVYEALTVGISLFIEKASYTEEEIIKLIKEKSMLLTRNEKFIKTINERTRPTERMTMMTEIGKDLFK